MLWNEKRDGSFLKGSALVYRVLILEMHVFIVVDFSRENITEFPFFQANIFTHCYF